MPDHSILNLTGQIGAETSAGAGGNANRVLRNTKLGLAAQGDFNEYKGEGQKYVTAVVPGDEWSSGNAGGPLSFSEIIYPFESMVKKITSPTSGPGGSYSRVYNSNASAPDTTQTYVIQKGDGVFNRQWNYCYWNDLTIAMSRKEATHDGTIFGQQTQIVQSLTASPTNVENVLVIPKQIDLFYGTDMASLGTTPTQILRAFDVEFKLGGRYNPFYPMNSALPSYGGIIESPDLDAMLTVKLGADVNAVSTWAATTAYTLGQVRKRLTGTGAYVFKVTTAGTSGASEPTWPSTLGGTVVDGTVTWTAILADYTDPINLGIMRAGALVYLRVKALGPLITGSTYYLLQGDFCGIVKAPPGDEDQDALALNSWDLRLTPDPVSNKPFEWTVVNKVAAI